MKKIELDMSPLREQGINGKIGFTISTYDTPENQEIHNEFLDFCKTETDGNRTIALKILMESLKEDFKYSSLFELIENLKERIILLEEKMESPKEDKEEKVF